MVSLALTFAALVLTAPATAEQPSDSKPSDSKISEASAPPSSQPVTAPQAEVNIKLRSLEERVNELKEKIFRSKARLVLLQEAVLHGTITGARAVLVHRNEMGGTFKLEQVQYSLDGAPIYNKVDTDGSLFDKSDEFEIFNGSIVPGNHQISVYLVYRGNGFGIFSYLSDLKFKIKSSYTFVAEEGKQTTVKVVGHEKGGISADLKDRPSVRYDVQVQKELRGPNDKSAKEGGTGSGASNDKAPKK